MNTLQTFSFESKPIRVYGTPDEPLFAAVDICNVLGLENTTRALERLEADEYSTLIITQGSSNNPELNAVNEAGLYRLVLESRKTEAKAFKRWLLHEVLPSIRKYGAYVPDEQTKELLQLLEQKKRLVAERDSLSSEIRVCDAQLRSLQIQITNPKALLKGGNSGELISKETVTAAFQEGKNRDIFKAARNWRSVKRWWAELSEGGTQ